MPWSSSQDAGSGYMLSWPNLSRTCANVGRRQSWSPHGQDNTILLNISEATQDLTLDGSFVLAISAGTEFQLPGTVSAADVKPWKHLPQ